MLHRLIAAGLIAMLAGCAAAPGPTYVLRATASDGRDLSNTEIDAETILESRQPTGVVSIQPTRQFSTYGAAFIVAVHNVGTTPLTFGPENVVVKIGETPVTVYSADALEEKVKRQVGAMMRAETTPSAFNRRGVEAASYAATQDHTYNNYGGCTAGNSGCSDGLALANYLRDENERARNYDVATRAAARLLRDTAAVNQQVLKSSTVKPGEMLGGVVVVGHPRIDQTLDVVVTFGGQPHKFSFRALPLA